MQTLLVWILFALLSLLLFGWVFFFFHLFFRASFLPFIRQLSNELFGVITAWLLTLGIILAALTALFFTWLGAARIMIFLFERFDLYQFTGGLEHIGDREQLATLMFITLFPPLCLIFVVIIWGIPAYLAEKQFLSRSTPT